MTDELKKIANSGGYGTGRAFRDRAAAEAECLALLPTDVRGEMCPACLRMNERLQWRKLHQDEQPRLSDGYTAVQYIRPGVYMVKGPGPAKHPVPSGDYHEGIEEGWKAGEAQERRIWEEAVELSFGTIPEGLWNALEQVRAGVEGE